MTIRLVAISAGGLAGVITERAQIALGNTDWAALAVTLVVAILTAGISYGLLKGKVDANDRRLSQVETTVEKHSGTLSAIAQDTAELVGEARERRRGRLRTRDSDTDEVPVPGSDR